MTQCKQCASTQKVKNGKVRGKQRYRCKHCGYNYVEGDERLKASLVVKKALALLRYALGKSSCGRLGTIFGVSRSGVQRAAVKFRSLREKPLALTHRVSPSE